MGKTVPFPKELFIADYLLLLISNHAIALSAMHVVHKSWPLVQWVIMTLCVCDRFLDRENYNVM
jgi:hypothetical protein